METKDEYLPFCLQTIDLKLYAIARQREVQSTLGLKSVATPAIVILLLQGCQHFWTQASITSEQNNYITLEIIHFTWK